MPDMVPSVEFGTEREAWFGYDAYLRALIRSLRPRRVLEIGGGANPALSIDEIRDLGLDYTVLDISATELQKAPAGYSKVVADIAAPQLPGELHEAFDFAFSKMLAEHVRSGEDFHRNVLAALAPGGHAFHFFPTLFSAPFLANKLLPEWLSARLLRRFAPRDEHMRNKFPAYYSWCRGPTAGMQSNLNRLGYRIVRYVGFFGHSYYRKLPALDRLQNAVARLLIRSPVPSLTSFAYLVVQKPNPALHEAG